MPASLFISEDYVKENSPIDDNVDMKVIRSAIIDVQEINILQYLGTDLYNKIDADIAASTIAGDYLTLLTEYIRPLHRCIVHEECVAWISFKFRNKGVMKQSDENNQAASLQDLQYLIDKLRNKSQFYGERMIDYLCANTDLFPEYISNTDAEDLQPIKRSYHQGLWMGNSRTYWSDRDGCCKED